MDLTFSSAFSTGGMVGHLAYFLLITSMLMRRMVWLRILAIAYAVVWLRDPVSSFWETLLVIVNVIQLLITWRQNSLAQFTPAEAEFAESRLRGLDRREQRKVLDAGTWQDMEPGTVLTVEGEEPGFLHYIADGEVEISRTGSPLARCGAHTYVGEMSLIGGRNASATATVTAPSRIWQISREAIAALDRKHPTWYAVIEAGISRDLREKILAQNEAILVTQGVPAS